MTKLKVSVPTLPSQLVALVDAKGQMTQQWYDFFSDLESFLNSLNNTLSDT